MFNVNIQYVCSVCMIQCYIIGAATEQLSRAGKHTESPGIRHIRVAGIVNHYLIMVKARRLFYLFIFSPLIFNEEAIQCRALISYGPSCRM